MLQVYLPYPVFQQKVRLMVKVKWHNCFRKFSYFDIYVLFSANFWFTSKGTLTFIQYMVYRYIPRLILGLLDIFRYHSSTFIPFDIRACHFFSVQYYHVSIFRVPTFKIKIEYSLQGRHLQRIYSVIKNVLRTVGIYLELFNRKAN